MQWSAVQIARAAWTRIAEPSDNKAHALIHIVGADIAYGMVTGTHPVDQSTLIRLARRIAGTEDAKLGEELYQSAMLRWQARLDFIEPQIEHDLEQLGKMGGRLVIPGHDEWPSQLNHLVVPPFALWVRGASRLPDYEKTVAVVGSRDCTNYGATITTEHTAGLAARGFSVVTGGAYGVDAAALRAAIHYSTPPPIAVLASGLDRFYPEGNRELLTSVAERGLVITEVPPGTPPTRWRFLQRNRIIAALSVATIVTEARWRSSALNVAQEANRLGRKTFAVPGSVYSASSSGTHRLIQEGTSVLLSEISQVIDALKVPSDV